MMGDYHVRFCERFGVKLPLPTRQAGGADGFWGNASQEAFVLLKTTLKKLLNSQQADIPIKLLTAKQIAHIQKVIMNSKNKTAAGLIKNAGGADGFWGNASQKAFEMMNTTIRALLQMDIR